jgi:eukaryotic-like serine/threonine-protein kinase
MSDAVLVAVVMALVVLLQVTTPLFNGLELKLYDAASTATERPPSDRIAVIAIDDTSIANIGRWPWPREVHAQLIDRLTEAGAKTIAHTAFFFEPQTDRGLTSLLALREQVQSTPPAAGLSDLGPGARSHLLGFLDQAEQTLDSDRQLATAIERSGRVILPSYFTLGEPLGPPDQPLPAFARAQALADGGSLGLPATASQQPLPALGNAARAVAHLNPSVDTDGAVRDEPLLVRFDGVAVPSMALAVAAHSLNLGPSDLRVLPGEGLMMGNTRIATDALGRVLPQFYPDRDGRPPFPTDAFYDVWAGKIPASKYAGKVVIIGATAAGLGTLFSTPVSPALSPAAIVAHTTSSILQNHFIAQPVWAGALVLGLIVLIGVYLMVVLPRLSATTGAAATAALLIGLLGTETLLLSRAAIWVQLVFPMALLLIGHLALVTRRFGITESRQRQASDESAETNRMMGLALQGQGQLDMAFDRLRRVPHSEALMDNLKHLALDFERKRQFNKAEAVYEHMARLDAADPDVKNRLQRARHLSETVVLGGSGAHPGGSLLLTGGGVEKPMLGRYQVDRELGKGAMGVVYQGRDPKIGRVVAIKTLALSAEFEGADLQDARERFFREAETAGRLQHPHIVTIYDAGEEHDLAYIAMEFLRGRDLVPHTRPGDLLPVATVLTIGERVAQALDYAHRHQVVHRDIKPGNIMFDPEADVVKVTDFGIARITDASRTKTGMVFGTPSFMSPEQLAGQRVDGQADVYALGVTLYQLLTGSLPFQAESLSALMYQIANQPAPDARTLRPDLPAALADVLQRCMAKQPALRCANAAQLAQDLRAILDSADKLTDVVSKLDDNRASSSAAFAPTQALHANIPDPVERPVEPESAEAGTTAPQR